METEFIVYVCPIGPLAEQLAAYFEKSREQIGPNKAHDYMPHCTLTGFFHDQPAAASIYTHVLDDAWAAARSNQSDPDIVIKNMLLTEKFHGFELESNWLKALVVDFAERAVSSTRSDAIRLKDWLHLSFAYGFAEEQHEPLARLAEEMVDMNTAVSWELRFYQRHADKNWTCHASWPLK